MASETMHNIYRGVEQPALPAAKSSKFLSTPNPIPEECVNSFFTDVQESLDPDPHFKKPHSDSGRSNKISPRQNKTTGTIKGRCSFFFIKSQ